MKVAIVGAGCVGRLLAWHCVKRGDTVSVFDKSVDDACAFVAGGMISPFAEIVDLDADVVRWGKRSLELWPQIVAEINTANKDGEPVFFNNPGTLYVGKAQDNPEGARLVRLLDKFGESDALTLLDKKALNDKAPLLAEQFEQAYLLKGEGYCEPSTLLDPIKQLLQSQCTWQENVEITELKPGQITVNGEQQMFDWVFDCRGLGAKVDYPDLRGVRGEMIHVHAPMIDIQHSVRLLHPRYPLYLVPYRDHVYSVGATTIEADDRSPISVRSAIELLNSLYALHPAFAEARIIRTLSHCRPALPDNKPRLKQQRGLTAFLGLYRHGYLVSPALIEEALEFINNG
jgi:glycine oxidase